MIYNFQKEYVGKFDLKLRVFDFSGSANSRFNPGDLIELISCVKSCKAGSLRNIRPRETDPENVYGVLEHLDTPSVDMNLNY